MIKNDSIFLSCDIKHQFFGFENSRNKRETMHTNNTKNIHNLNLSYGLLIEGITYKTINGNIHSVYLVLLLCQAHATYT